MPRIKRVFKKRRNVGIPKNKIKTHKDVNKHASTQPVSTDEGFIKNEIQIYDVHNDNESSSPMEEEDPLKTEIKTETVNYAENDFEIVWVRNSPNRHKPEDPPPTEAGVLKTGDQRTPKNCTETELQNSSSSSDIAICDSESSLPPMNTGIQNKEFAKKAIKSNLEENRLKNKLKRSNVDRKRRLQFGDRTISPYKKIVEDEYDEESYRYSDTITDDSDDGVVPRKIYKKLKNSYDELKEKSCVRKDCLSLQAKYESLMEKLIETQDLNIQLQKQLLSLVTPSSNTNATAPPTVTSCKRNKTAQSPKWISGKTDSLRDTPCTSPRSVETQNEDVSSTNVKNNSTNGIKNFASSINDSAIGTNHSVSRTNNSASDTNNSASGINNCACGIEHSASGINNSDCGIEHSACGINNSDCGISNSASGINNSARGINNSARGINNSARGINNSARGINNSARGINNSARGINNSARGINNSASGMNYSDAKSLTDKDMEETFNISRESLLLAKRVKRGIAGDSKFAKNLAALLWEPRVLQTSSVMGRRCNSVSHSEAKKRLTPHKLHQLRNMFIERILEEEPNVSPDLLDLRCNKINQYISQKIATLNRQDKNS